jgi:hypothetical protein
MLRLGTDVCHLAGFGQDFLPFADVMTPVLSPAHVDEQEPAG